MIDFVLFLDFVLVVALGLSFYRRLGSDMLFHGFILYLLFHCFVFLLRPFLSYNFNFSTAWRYMDIWPTNDEYVFNLLLSMFGLLCVYGGSILGLRARCLDRGKLSGAGRRVMWSSNSNEITALLCVAAVLLPLGLWSLVYASGTHEVMIMDPTNKKLIFTQGTGYFFELYNIVGPILFLWAYLNRMSLTSLFPLLLYIAYRVELGWGRFGFVLLMISMMLFWTYARGFSWRAFIVAPVALLLFQFAGRMRGNQIVGTEWYQKLDTLDFANFEYLTFVTRNVPHMTNSYTYFTQYLQLFTEPIPRALWSSKPVGPPIQFFNLQDFGNFTGLTVSLIGDGWMSLGVIGVTVMTVGTGFALSKAFNWFEARRHQKIAVAIYLVALPTCIQWFRDGGISIAKFMFFLVGPIFLWVCMTRLLEVLAGKFQRTRRMSTKYRLHAGAVGNRHRRVADVVERGFRASPRRDSADGEP